MSVSFQSQILKKCPDVAISSMVGKLPRNGEFYMDDDGRFKLVYTDEQVGKPGHYEKSIANRFEGTTIKLSKVVSGRLDSVNKCITFDEGCITATKSVGWTSIDISLREIKSIDEETIQALGSWGWLSKSANVSRDTLLFANVDWKK